MMKMPRQFEPPGQGESSEWPGLGRARAPPGLAPPVTAVLTEAPTPTPGSGASASGTGGGRCI